LSFSGGREGREETEGPRTAAHTADDTATREEKQTVLWSVDMAEGDGSENLSLHSSDDAEEVPPPKELT